MSHSKRFEKLLELENLSRAQFCKSIAYVPKNLSNYLRGNTTNPNGELVIGVLKEYPHWNLRYWLLGEGQPRVGKEDLNVFEEEILTYKKDQPIIKELTEQLAYMRKEIHRKDRELALKDQEIERLRLALESGA